MPEKKQGAAKRMKAEGNVSSVRATISFPPDVYETLVVIAKEKKVSLAWVVREATEKYVEDKWPLFRGREIASQRSRSLQRDVVGGSDS